MKFMPNIEYLFRKDANWAKTKSPDLIVVVYNGLDYYTPTAPKEITHMTRNCTTASTYIKNAVGLIDKIVLDLLPSTAHDSLMKSLKFMRAANLHLEGTSLTTGTAVSTGMPFQVPIPKTATSSSVAKSVHKRAAASLGREAKQMNRLHHGRKSILQLFLKQQHKVQKWRRFNVHVQIFIHPWKNC